MKLTKTLMAVSVSAALIAPLAAQADTTLSGSFGFKGVSTDNDAVDLWWGSSKSRINIKNSRNTSGGSKVTAELEVDWDTPANAGGKVSTGDLEIRTAKLSSSGGFGTVVMAGRTASGQWNNLVGPVDIMQHGGANFFEQGSRASSVLAYVTPAFAGGLKFILAGVATGSGAGLTDNGEDIDALVYRLQYNSKSFNAAIGLVDPQANDHQRMGLGASTSFGPVKLGLAYESTTDKGGVAGADKDVAGVSAQFSAGAGIGIALGLNTVLSDDTGGGLEDAQAYQIALTKSIGKKMSVWIEHDGYNDEAGADAQTAIGMNYAF